MDGRLRLPVLGCGRGLVCLVLLMAEDRIPQEDLEALHAENPEALFADGLESAFIGYGGQYCKATLAVYDADKCIEALVKGGMTYEGAREWFDFNVACAWVGDGTPIFITPRSDD